MQIFGYARPSAAHLDHDLARLSAHCQSDMLRVEAERASRREIDGILDSLHAGDRILVTRLSQFGINLEEALHTMLALQQKQADIYLLTLQDGRDEPVLVDPDMVRSAWQIGQEIKLERQRLGMLAAQSSGRGPGRKSEVSDLEIMTAKQMLGTNAGARSVGLSKTQFLRRLKQIDGGEMAVAA